MVIYTFKGGLFINNRVRNLVFGALCTAVGVFLPSIFHMFGWSGAVFLPMHIPVLICGFLCGFPYGGLCRILVPFLSSIITGMPPLFPVDTAMMLELCTYGILTGLLYEKMNLFNSNNPYCLTKIWIYGR